MASGAGNAWLLGGLFVYALSFGHHLMTVLALPGIAWLVWSDRQRAVTLRNAVWVAGFGLVGAAQYLYLLYMARVGLYVEVPVRNLGDLWDLVRGGEFKDEMWGFSLFQWLEVRVPLLGEVVGAEYLLLQATIFATNYDVFDVQVFFLPLLFVLAVFLGLGLEGIITGVVDYRRSSQRGNFEDAQRIERAIDVADRDALFLTDNYAETQCLAYYLVVDRLGEERNLAVVGRVGVSVKDIKRYLHDGSGHVATTTAQVTDVRQPRLFVAYSALATRLERSGLEVIQLDPELWQVRYPTNWTPRR